jgi:hypothetical protein
VEQYKHTQIGYVIIAGLGAGILIVLSILLTQRRDWVMVLVLFIMTIATILFVSLTIEIAEGVLTISFGPGIIRKTVHIADIEACKVVRNPWYFGWGIRLTPHGWLYNVSGTQGVEITLKGGRRFRLGSDEPEVLCQAITLSLSKPAAF